MNDVNYVTLGELVQKMLDEAGMSVTEAAKRAAVSRNTMTSWSRSGDPAADHASEIVAVSRATNFSLLNALGVAGLITESDFASSKYAGSLPPEEVFAQAGRLLGKAVEAILGGLHAQEDKEK